jgi:hypothetical protein
VPCRFRPTVNLWARVILNVLPSRVDAGKSPAEASRLSNGRVQVFAKTTNRTHKSRQHLGPTRSKSNLCFSGEQVDVGCVPGMNGSALRISQSVRDAAHITITVPQTCPFLNVRAKTMSSVTLYDIHVVVAQQLLRATLGRFRLFAIPLEWVMKAIQDHTGLMWGLPPSITFALSWQPLCCSSNFQGVECGGAWKGCDVFPEVQILANQIHPRARIQCKDFPKGSTNSCMDLA